MTNFETKQDNVVFVNAGKTAFKMGIHILDNPYKVNPFKILWEKGYKNEKRRFNGERYKRQRMIQENA